MRDLEDIEFLQAELHKRDEEIKELKEKLKNAIIPKFKIGQEVYWSCGLYDTNEIRSFTINSIEMFKNINIYFDNDETWLTEKDLFATKEEAEKILKELKGEVKK